MTAQPAELAQFRQDADYYAEQFEQLLARYPDQWIAIYQRALVAAAADLPGLLAALRERGIPVEETLVKYLSTEEPVLIL
jgi:hypothetical protein